MNEDEPKWIELRDENISRYIRFSDALIISKGYSGRIEVQTTLRAEPMTAKEIFACDFFGRRITDFEFNR